MIQKASQRRLSDSVQDADLLSLHLRMHVGREERAADHQNVGQRTMTSSLRACDLRLHNSDPPTTTTTTTSPSATQYKPREEAASTPPHLPFSLSGGEGRDRPGLRSDFAGRKGKGSGALDKSAAVALFHPVSPSRPARSTQPEVEFLPCNKSSKAGPNLVAAVFRNNARLL